MISSGTLTFKLLDSQDSIFDDKKEQQLEDNKGQEATKEATIQEQQAKQKEKAAPAEDKTVTYESKKEKWSTTLTQQTIKTT